MLRKNPTFQDSTNISEILELGEGEVSSERKEEARASVERFLQVIGSGGPDELPDEHHVSKTLTIN